MFNAAAFFGHGQAAPIACHPLRVVYDTRYAFFSRVRGGGRCMFGCTREGVHICAVLSEMICASLHLMRTIAHLP